MDEREKAARLDLLKFQVGELDKARLRPGEDEELETTRRVLGSADKLQRLCGEAYAALYDSDEAALARLGSVWKRVAELADVDPAFQPHLDARDAIKSQLEDLAQTLRAYGEDIDASPARLQEVEDRLALLERLKRKYGPALADVIAKRDALSRQLDALENADERRAGLEAETRVGESEFLLRARALSRSARGRREAVRHPHSGAARRAGDGAHAIRSAIRGGAARDGMDRNRRGCGRVLSLGERGGGPAAARAHCQRRRALARDARHPDAGRGRRARQDAHLR